LLVLSLAGGCEHLLPLSATPPAARALDHRPAERAAERQRPDTCVTCTVGSSCDELARCGCARSGIVTLTAGSATFPAYCELELVPGEGWMLVGRSTAGGSCAQGFGWSSSCGSVGDDAGPYSLNVVALTQLPLTEMLVGTRASGKQWGANVYRFKLPADVRTGYLNEACLLDSGSVVKGACTPPFGVSPFMLAYGGHLGYPIGFFFRDGPLIMNLGLMPGGFNIAEPLGGASSCERWGDLKSGASLSSQGMIFVR
jgi:hypothetical protein